MNLSTALQQAVGRCAQPYYRHKRRQEREGRVPRDYGYLLRPRRQTLEERLFEIFPAALAKASNDGAFVPMVRQVYYVVRQMLQAAGCRDELTDAYHRTVLQKYEVEVAGERLCYRKAVGDLIEPHSECPTCRRPHGVSLGTEGVAHYVVPAHRFNKVLYVEKVGFLQQLLRADVHNRFDVALAAGAGFAPEAARELFAKIDRSIPATFYCVHDADIAGLEIARTLQKQLVHEDYQVRVVDLGLRPAGAMALALPSESVEITAGVSDELQASVSAEELAWLLGECVMARRQYRKSRRVMYRGERVELNAFTPREFIDWIERKLAAEAPKVVPDETVIEEAFARRLREAVRGAVAAELLKRFDVDAFLATLPAIPAPTVATIRETFEEQPEVGWEDVVQTAVSAGVDTMKIG